MAKKDKQRSNKSAREVPISEAVALFAKDLKTQERESPLRTSLQSAYISREGLLVPKFIVEFLSSYINFRNPTSILDPAAGIGSLLTPIVRAHSITKAIAVKPNQSFKIGAGWGTPGQLPIAETLSKGLPIEWVEGAAVTALEGLGQFDVVVSSPPIGLRSIKLPFYTTDGPIEVKGSETFLLAIQAALHLSETGEAIYLFPNSFFFGHASDEVRAVLPKLGLHINAIIALPAGTFAPATSIELNLVFISRQAADQVFVGSLSSDRDPAPLLKNLRARKEGPVPELGRLIRLEDYRGMRVLVAAEEEKRLADRSGLTRIALAEIVEAVNLADRRKEEAEAFADLPNSVYLPLIGTSPAVSALSDLRIKPHNYAQLVVNPDKAYAGFLAEFFNSALGRKTRDSLLSGTTIPKITKQTLSVATVYTLPLEIQDVAVGVSREIEELRLRLQQLEQQLWSRPVEAGKVRKALGKLNQKESFEGWLETLPFPLASILQRYNASIKSESKVTHLLNFFEAATQFLGTLMTSAFHSDQQFFQAHKREWFEAGKDNPHSLARSAFGEWVVRCQRLAKSTRQMLSSDEKDEQNRCLGLYRVSDREKIGTVADKNLYPLLEKTSRYRNAWKGHPGIVGKKEHDRRLALLQEELTRFRAIVGTVFEDWWLIRPGSAMYTAGLYTYEVSKLMGSHLIFREAKLETSTAMDANELYFFDSTVRQPLPILHFFRMMSVPESEEIACYFFNRIEQRGARWVSYHFEGSSERLEHDSSVLKLIAEVEQNNGASSPMPSILSKAFSGNL